MHFRMPLCGWLNRSPDLRIRLQSYFKVLYISPSHGRSSRGVTYPLLVLSLAMIDYQPLLRYADFAQTTSRFRAENEPRCPRLYRGMAPCGAGSVSACAYGPIIPSILYPLTIRILLVGLLVCNHHAFTRSRSLGGSDSCEPSPCCDHSCSMSSGYQACYGTESAEACERFLLIFPSNSSCYHDVDTDEDEV